MLTRVRAARVDWARGRCAQSDWRGASMGPTNSKRMLFTANHVSTTLSDEDQQAVAGTSEGALRKLNFVHALRVSPTEVKRLRERIIREDSDLRQVLAV